MGGGRGQLSPGNLCPRGLCPRTVCPGDCPRNLSSRDVCPRGFCSRPCPRSPIFRICVPGPNFLILCPRPCPRPPDSVPVPRFPNFLSPFPSRDGDPSPQCPPLLKNILRFEQILGFDYGFILGSKNFGVF